MFSNNPNQADKPAESLPSSLPYPEEPPDPNLRISGEQLLQQFFSKYFIPPQHWDFWRTVEIRIDPTFSSPAGMISQTKTLILRPEYANAGILAHEFSHLSYYLMSEEEKAHFASDYINIIQKNPLLRFLYFQKPYIKSSLVETHAEIFRYLGLKMPEGLKSYYPKLIG